MSDDDPASTAVPGVRVEQATAEDVDAVLDMWVDLAANQRDRGSHVLSAENREPMRQVLAAYQVADGLLVARRDDRLLGFASFSVERGSLDLDVTRGSLSNLYVRPDARGAGVGSALLDAVERALADRGVDLVTLEAMADNADALRFYRRHGYDRYRVALERRLDGGGENDTHSKDHG